MGSDIEAIPSQHPLPAPIQAVCDNLPHGGLNKVPPQIPKEWKACATAFFCDVQFYKAITRILWRFKKSDEVMQKLVDRPMPRHYVDIKKKIRTARWIKKGELPLGSWGIYQTPCNGVMKKGDCIRINPATYVPDNDARHPLLTEKEEWIVKKALALYVQNKPPPDPLPIGIEAAIAACTKPPKCASVSPARTPEPQGSFMAPSLLSPVPGIPQRDFNNDGNLDYVKDETFCVLYDYHPDLLPPPQTAGEYSISEYRDDCPLPFPKQEKLVWEMSLPDYGLGKEDFRYDFLRFFNSKRSMSFAPGEVVAQRTGTHNQFLKSIIILYDLYQDQKEQNAEPKLYALLSGCQLVGLDEIITVTDENVRLDMERAKVLAGLATSTEKTPTAPTAAETEMAALLKSAARQVTERSKTPERDIRCTEILSAMPKTPLTSQLPDGWEKGFCFTLGISPYPPPSGGPGGMEAPRGAGVSQ